MPCSPAPLLAYHCSCSAHGGFLMFVHSASAAADASVCSLWRPGAVAPRSQCRATLTGGWSQHH
eukprot:1888526-Amphidinium_carterae.1